MPTSKVTIFSFLIAFLSCFPFFTKSQELPVKNPASMGLMEIEFLNVRNLLSFEQIDLAIQDGNEHGLYFDLSPIKTFLNGTPIDLARIYGTLYVGPYPFEAFETDYTYKRFRRASKIEQGRGTIDIGYLLEPSHNSEGWEDKGKVCIRAELYLDSFGKDKNLGTYDVFARFKIQKQGSFVKIPSVTSGPFVGLITSDDPTSMLISFRISKDLRASVVVSGKRFSQDYPSKAHEVRITGLAPDTLYDYHVEMEGFRTKTYRFKTAPDRPREVLFAYSGDSREGVGGAERALMGVNAAILERLMNLAYRKNIDFFIFGGDLVNGYTSSKEDFGTMLYAWKQVVSGFWHERPVYPGMGNHESLIKVFGDGSIQLDRWPYETDSAEVLFAQNFLNPENSPPPSDPRRPTYKENVYSFTYGPIRVMAFNNNYWRSSNPKEFGGCPEGYILPDQMEWIQKELDRAQKDPSVRFIVLFAQEPVIPNGGHIKDAMWYKGNNNVQAYTYRSGGLVPEQKGILDVRNELIKMVTHYSKVACVLGSDEHAYHRTLVTKAVPLGNPAKDDANGNGIVCEEGESCSPLDIQHATWFITSGGAGAPYYAEELTPWNVYWKENNPENYLYTSQPNMLTFKTNGAGLSLETYNAYGQIIDRVNDLMAVK